MGGENGIQFYEYKPERRKLFKRKHKPIIWDEMGLWQADWLDELLAPPRKIEVRAGNLGTQMGFGTPVIVRVIKRTRIEVTDGSE